MGCSNINFISNNVREIKNLDKRIKIFEYFKNKVESNGVLFLWKTHSCEKGKKRWNDDFKGTLFFSHGTANFFEVAIRYSGAKSFFLEEENEQEWSHEQNFVLVNLYKANTEKD